MLSRMHNLVYELKGRRSPCASSRYSIGLHFSTLEQLCYAMVCINIVITHTSRLALSSGKVDAYSNLSSYLVCISKKQS